MRQHLGTHSPPTLDTLRNSVFGKSRNAGLADFSLPPFHEARARACSSARASSNPSVSNFTPASRAASTMKSSGSPNVSYR